ncbi:MAG: PEP-CTERM sorting domain-containing protein [Chitinivorax sp.]
MTLIKLGALALASLTNAATAAVSGSANIDLTSFSYSIADADLNDGITPTLSFSDDYAFYTRSPVFGGASSVYAPANIPNSGSGGFYQSAGAQSHFRVSGPAQITFRANYTLHNAVAVPGDDGSYAHTRAQLAAGFNLFNAGGFGIDAQENHADSGWFPSSSRNGTLEISFNSAGEAFLPDSEDGNAYAYGFLNLNSEVTLYQATAAVPEPSEYLMLLVGLGVVGTVVRRSRRL